MLANCRGCQVRRLHFCIFYGEKREQMQNFERIFDMHQPPFKADSLDAMEYSILGFFKAEDSSRPQLERISDHEIKVSIDERKAQKAQKQFDKAVEHSNAHKFNSARFALREAIGLWPYNSEYHRLLAQVTMEGGDLEKAQDSCLDALLLDDKNLWALLLMGNILNAKGNTEAADGYFSKILQYHPDNALALNNLGGIYCKQGKYAKGKELFEKSLSIDPENLNPYYGMALTQYRMQDYAGAFDWTMQGLEKGSERPENMAMRPLLIQLAKDASSKLDDDSAMLSKAMDVALELGQKYGKPVKLQKDENQPFMAHLEFGDFYGRNYHIIKYRQQGHFIHLVLHELMHLEMMEEAKAARKLLKIGFKQENFDLFLDKFTPSLQKVVKLMGEAKAGQFAKQLFTGISQQVMNNPLDLFVETKIYEQHPQFRPVQFSSLYDMEETNLKAIKDSARSEYIPAEIKSASRCLNMISSLFLERHYHCSLFKNFSTSELDDEFARLSYNKFERAWNSHSAGSEYELFIDLAEVMEMKDYFTITNAADGASKVDEEIETEADRQQRKFDETHGKNDDMVNMMMSQYMLAALLDFDKMDYEQVKEISRECAFTGVNGISVGGDKTYTLKAFPGKQFSGYEFLAYYYVSWAIAEPEHLLDTGLPFHKAYSMARQMWENRR